MRYDTWHGFARAESMRNARVRTCEVVFGSRCAEKCGESRIDSIASAEALHVSEETVQDGTTHEVM